MSATSITLTASNGRVSIAADGTILGTVKDGGQIVRNADRVLKANGVLRATCYSLSNGALTAEGVRL